MRVWGLRYLSYFRAVAANLACALVVARPLSLGFGFHVFFQFVSHHVAERSEARAFA